MAEVKVLVNGEHTWNEEKKLMIGSTVTLIKTDKNILVDAGTFKDKEKLLNSLKEEGLTPEDIDIVFLTHLHLDHIVNVHLFNKSMIMLKLIKGEYPGQIQRLNQGTLERTEIKDGVEIAKDVECLLTPGHSGDMVSLIVNTDKGRIVIAGDAIPNKKMADLNNEPLPALIVDMNDFNKSRKKILEIADYIVPGHGDMFKVEK